MSKQKTESDQCKKILDINAKDYECLERAFHVKPHRLQAQNTINKKDKL